MNDGIVLTKIDSRGIAEVTLNRPERNNAYNGEMISELIKSFTSLYDNNDVRMVLIRGLGKHFQGGADLEWLKEIGKLNEAKLHIFPNFFMRFSFSSYFNESYFHGTKFT